MTFQIYDEKIGFGRYNYPTAESAQSFIDSLPEEVRKFYKVREKPSPALRVKREEPGLPTTQDLPTHALVASLTLLAQAIGEQTQSINRLADSNRDLVQAMAEDSGMDGEEGQSVGVYLNNRFGVDGNR